MVLSSCGVAQSSLMPQQWGPGRTPSLSCPPRGSENLLSEVSGTDLVWMGHLLPPPGGLRAWRCLACRPSTHLSPVPSHSLGMGVSTWSLSGT